MAARKKTPPPACLDCQHLLAELAKVQRQQRQQATDLRNSQAMLSLQKTQLAELGKMYQEANACYFSLLADYKKVLRNGNLWREKCLRMRQYLAASPVVLRLSDNELLTPILYPN